MVELSCSITQASCTNVQHWRHDSRSTPRCRLRRCTDVLRGGTDHGVDRRGPDGVAVDVLPPAQPRPGGPAGAELDRKRTRLNSSHAAMSYAGQRVSKTTAQELG